MQNIFKTLKKFRKLFCYIISFAICGTIYCYDNIIQNAGYIDYDNIDGGNVSVMANVPETTNIPDIPDITDIINDSDIPMPLEDSPFDELERTTEIKETNEIESDVTENTAITAEPIEIPEITIIEPETAQTIQSQPTQPNTNNRNNTSADETINVKNDVLTKNKPQREILINAFGDLTLASNFKKDYYNSFYHYYDRYGPEYFFKDVISVLSESDLNVANLECALTDNKNNRIKEDYAYRGYKEYTSILTSGNIQVVNLANNHSLDYSEIGYNDTITALNTAGIEYFGFGNALIKEINGIKVGFIGFLGSANVTAERKQTIKKELEYLEKNGAELKIVTFHWGNMDEKTANNNQQNLAHFVIDNGADLVIGHHPHVLQGIEIYKGKYIAYSLGNFIFDGNVISNVDHRTSIIFQQKFIFEGDEIIESSINIIPIITTESLSSNDFKPYIAQGKAKEDILKKIQDRSIY